jgi:hypothetical protein
MTSYTNAVQRTAQELDLDEWDLLNAVEIANNWRELHSAVFNQYPEQMESKIMETLDAYGLYYVDEQPEYRA